MILKMILLNICSLEISNMKIVYDELLLQETSPEMILDELKRILKDYDYIDNDLSYEIYASKGALRVRVYEAKYHD